MLSWINRLNLSRCDRKSDDNNRSIVIDIQYVAMLSGIYIQVCSSIAESREIFSSIISFLVFADRSYTMYKGQINTCTRRGANVFDFLLRRKGRKNAHRCGAFFFSFFFGGANKYSVSGDRGRGSGGVAATPRGSQRA